MRLDGHKARTSVAALVFVAGCGVFGSQASIAGPFDAFAGSARGGGEVISRDGGRERISCRVNSSVSQGGASMTQSMVCASDNYRLDIRASAVADGDRVSGQWQEATRGVQGSLAGRVSGGQFNGAVSGSGFAAAVSMRAAGRRSVYTLRPNAGDISSVSVVLTR
jgi:hypothetical protein